MALHATGPPQRVVTKTADPMLQSIHPVAHYGAVLWHLLIFLAVTVSGCGADNGSDPSQDSGIEDADAATDYRFQLSVRPQGQLAVPAGENITLEVYLEDASGSPVPDEVVSFTLSASAQDSALEFLSVTTDSDGLAENQVYAGSIPTLFKVRIRATSAEPIEVAINAGPEGFGWLEVDASYAGQRNPQTRVISVFSNVTCADLNDTSQTILPQYTSILQSRTSERFYLLASPEYAVYAEALGAGDIELAHACIDRLELMERQSHSVAIPWQDEPLELEGSYDATLSLNAAAPVTTLLGRAKQAMAERVAELSELDPERHAAGAEEAAYLLAALMDAMGDLPEDSQVAPELAELTSNPPRWEVSLQAALDTAGVGPSRGAQWLVSTAQNSLRDLTLTLQLDVATHEDGGDYEITAEPQSVQGKAIDGLAPTLSLLDQGASLVDAVASAGNTELRLDLPLALPLVELGRRALGAIATAELEDNNEHLALHLGCRTLEEWWQTQAVVAVPACDTECVERACGRVIADLLSTSSAALSEIAEASGAQATVSPSVEVAADSEEAATTVTSAPEASDGAETTAPSGGSSPSTPTDGESASETTEVDAAEDPLTAATDDLASEDTTDRSDGVTWVPLQLHLADSSGNLNADKLYSEVFDATWRAPEDPAVTGILYGALQGTRRGREVRAGNVE